MNIKFIAVLGCAALMATTSLADAPKVAAEAVTTTKDNAKSIDLAGIMKTINTYVNGGRKGDSKITRKAFMPKATMSWNENGQRKTVPIQALYDYVDNAGAMDVSVDEVKVVAATPTTAVVAAETRFGKDLYTDMFAIVKDGDSWKIAAKVYHVKKEAKPFNQMSIDREGILRAVEYYTEGGCKPSAEIGLKAFIPNASMTWEENGRLQTTNIESLFEMCKTWGRQTVNWHLAGIVATEDTAIVAIEPDFSVAGSYTDSFALVKDGDEWKIVAKIYHLKKGKQ